MTDGNVRVRFPAAAASRKLILPAFRCNNGLSVLTTRFARIPLFMRLWKERRPREGSSSAAFAIVLCELCGYKLLTAEDAEDSQSKKRASSKTPISFGSPGTESRPPLQDRPRRHFSLRAATPSVPVRPAHTPRAPPPPLAARPHRR